MTPPNGPDTIIALSSGQGRSGVAVLRVTGPRAFQLALEAREQDPMQSLIALLPSILSVDQ